MEFKIKDLKLILSLNLDKILSLKELVYNSKFGVNYLKKVKNKIIRGKIHSIYFDDLYFEISYKLCSYELKRILNFLCDNKANLPLIKELVYKLDILGVNRLEIIDSLELNKEYILNLENMIDGSMEKAYTDGNVILGTIKEDEKSYTQTVEGAKYIIFVNDGYTGNNRIVLSDLYNIYDKLPTKEQLDSYMIDLKKLKINTKNKKSISSIIELKEKIIELESSINKLLKKSGLLSPEKNEELREKLNGLYDLMRSIKSIESDLEEKGIVSSSKWCFKKGKNKRVNHE